MAQQIDPVVVRIPYPPSANTYWRRKGSQYFICPSGRNFREIVMGEVLKAGGVRRWECPVHVSIVLHPKVNKNGSLSKIRVDLDNIFKATHDALAYAGVFRNDSQVARIDAEWGEPVRHGAAVVRVEPWQRC